MTSDRIPASRLVALALVVGTFFVAQEGLSQLASGKRTDLGNAVSVVLIFWAVWAFLAPAVLAAVRRWPLETKPAYRTLLVHTVIATLLAAVHSTLTIPIRSIAFSLRGEVGVIEWMRRASLTAFVWGVFTGIVFYAVLVMVYTVLRFRTLYMAEQMSAAALAAELTQSKLDTLRSQLRPHFLFNTLNAISVFVAEDADKAQQMILRLSSLLRRSLDEEAHEVSLRVELAFVNDYLDIQRGRFGDQLTVNVVIDPTVLEARVPVFLLQPLLENAIEHGKSDDRPTTVALSASRDGNMLRLSLEDDGPGIENDGPVREGIGVTNTRARLSHLYGSRATAALGLAHPAATRPGTRVEILIPFTESSR